MRGKYNRNKNEMGRIRTQVLSNYNFELLRLFDSGQQFVIAFSESDKSGAL